MSHFFQKVRQAFVASEAVSKAIAVGEISMQDFNATLNDAANHAPCETAKFHISSPETAPGIPSKPLLVDPKTLPKRKLGSVKGRQLMIHAIAHIEFSAINLALDAIQRFPQMPREYHADWLSVAQDEAKHFLMLEQRLQELDSTYGDHPAHDGLWHMAEVTRHDVLERMAIVPRMMEARGLDMNPLIMQRLKAVDDKETVRLLEIILQDEINHVSIGNKWFHYCCGLYSKPPNATFEALFMQHFNTSPKGALNIDARLKAGFTYDELDFLQDMAKNF